MDILGDRDLRPALLGGGILHLIMLFTQVEWLKFSCKNACSDILVYDIPASILYFAFPDFLVIIFSLVVGSLQWAVWAWLILKIFRGIFRSRSRA